MENTKAIHEFAGLADAARRLRLPVGWLRDEARAARVPCLWAGRKPMFNVDAVRVALARRAADGEVKRVTHGQEGVADAR